MLNNLRKELRGKNITIRAYADFLGVREKTISNKLDGITEFTYPEAAKTQSCMFPEYNMEYLFADDGKKPPKQAS